jgi:hypothetical protein
VLHLGPDGEELYEDGEPVIREEQEYYLYKLERLLKLDQQNDSAATLQPSYVFIKAAYDQEPTIKPEQFRMRFKEFLQHLEQPAPSAETLDSFFHLAVQAEKEILAWENTVRAIKGDEFNRSLERLRAEVARFEKIRKVFQGRKMASWMSPWGRLWIEAFEELEELIEGQLRGAKSYLERLSQLSKLGRTDVESQVLLLNNRSLKNVIAGTPLSKAPAVVLAAFAYAARLVRSKDDTNDPKGKYVNLIKARIKRAKRSKVKADIWATLIMSGLQRTESAGREILPGS